MKLEDKVAIVTGGGQGIGEGIVRCLAEEGAHVAIIDLNGENARRLAGEVEAMGRKSLAIEADCTDNTQVVKAVEDTVATFGQLDILINNVGGNKGGSSNITNRTEEEWQWSYDINLKSTIIMTKAVAPHFIRQKSGKIINISSGAAIQPVGGGTMPYATFKAAGKVLTRNLAAELAGANINVNCILPGLVYTPLWAQGATSMHSTAVKQARESGSAGGLDLEELEKMTPHEWWLRFVVAPAIPLKREQTTEDIGKAAVFLVSEDAKNVTGQALSVNGGEFM
jgi:NAD(P)-dependent dehydrogenase (short-subunit alcohol dehydrogenase family)